MVIQTPYDEWHRRPEHWTVRFRESGIRSVYIPYGIEISDTNDSHNLHFRTSVINNCWRIFTFSEMIRRDYLRYSLNGEAVRVLGLPRFDSIYNKKQFQLPSELVKKIKGRKIVIWKIHFIKNIIENKRNILVTPDINEYSIFSKKLNLYNDFFFIVMPHPKCKSQNIEMFSRIASYDNCFIDENDDYRNSLYNADCIIVDRSAIMVEAGGLNLPTLYMSNDKYQEPFVEAINPLVESYYQGTTCKDIDNFLKMCSQNKDPKKDVRTKAFQKCIPFFDGRCGERILENLITDIQNNLK